jgi:hypothetical protein
VSCEGELETDPMVERAAQADMMFGRLGHCNSEHCCSGERRTSIALAAAALVRRDLLMTAAVRVCLPGGQENLTSRK